MGYYGKGYRGEGGRGQGFQSPSPGGPNGPRSPGKLAPSPAPPKPGKPRFTIPKFPKRVLQKLPGPYREFMQAYRKAKLVYKFVEHNWPELLPYTPEQPPRVDVSNYDCVYDCPSVTEPYLTPTMVKFQGASCPIPEYLKCLPLQVPNGDVEELYPDGYTGNPAYVGAIMVGPADFFDGGEPIRMTVDKIYVRSTPGMNVRIWHRKKPMYVLAPAPYYTEDPDEAPIQQPAPFPLHVPYPLIPTRPHVSPWPQGYKRDQPTTGIRPKPTLKPYGDPLAGPSVSVDGKGPPVPGDPHIFMPPGPGEKEKKGKPPVDLKPIMDKIGGPLGEMGDAIEAVYDALGNKCKDAKSPQAKLRCIYNNFDSLDYGQAVRNLVINEVEDRVIGKFGKALKSTGNKRPSKLTGIGWGVGPGI